MHPIDEGVFREESMKVYGEIIDERVTDKKKKKKREEEYGRNCTNSYRAKFDLQLTEKGI